MKKKENLQKQELDYAKIGKTAFQKEIDALNLIANDLGEEFSEAVKIVLQSKEKIIFVGIGKSAHIANKIVATLNSTGTPSQFLHAAEAVHGDLGLLDKNNVCFVLSKSGNTPEIVNLLQIIKDRCSAIIAITSNRESILGKTANVVLETKINSEACPNNLAPTTSTTAQLVMGDALSIALMEGRHFKPVDFAKYHPGGALGKKLLLKVADIIDDEKPKVSEDDEMKKVIISLSNGKHGITAVFNENKMTGIITDGDLRRALEKHDDIMQLKSKDIMTKSPKTILGETLAKEALVELKTHDIGQLVVKNEKNEYVGILDFNDLLKEGLD